VTDDVLEDEVDTPLRQPPFVQAMAVCPTDPPPRMDHHERMQLRAAAFRATRVFPGPVGELICKELMDWETMGVRLGSHGMIRRLVAAVMSAELPVPPAPVVAA
jgi:hypothetical protein